MKANPPIKNYRNSQEVDYFAATATGAAVGDHVLGLSETFVGPHTTGTDICTPCIQKNKDLIHAGEFEDTQTVNPNAPFTVERRWTVDGQSAQVLNQNNIPFDFEILHLSNESNPVFQLEYKNDPSQ